LSIETLEGETIPSLRTKTGEVIALTGAIDELFNERSLERLAVFPRVQGGFYIAYPEEGTTASRRTIDSQGVVTEDGTYQAVDIDVMPRLRGVDRCMVEPSGDAVCDVIVRDLVGVVFHIATRFSMEAPPEMIYPLCLTLTEACLNREPRRDIKALFMND
jgi:hypothetical protein